LIPPRSTEETKAYLLDFDIQDSGFSNLIRAIYHLLELASYFATGEMEITAWTIKVGIKASQCAGIIHRNF
jgi:ribosome-binding ATPase YchF (GTP1/OBG family)